MCWCEARRESQRQVELIGRAVAHGLDGYLHAVHPFCTEHGLVVGFFATSR